VDDYDIPSALIETELLPNNMNREEGFSLSKSWKPVIQILKELKKAL
jgi:hypothetical protein